MSETMKNAKLLAESGEWLAGFTSEAAKGTAAVHFVAALRAALAAATAREEAHTERVVRWCYAEVYGERPADGKVGMFGYTQQVWDQGCAIWLARALAAAKGGA